MEMVVLETCIARFFNDEENIWDSKTNGKKPGSTLGLRD